MKPKRLDHFLVAKLSLSRAKIQTLIKNGKITVNGCPQYKSGLLIDAKDTVQVDDIETISLLTQDKKIPPPELRFIYEDTDILIIDKPKGVVVHHGVKVLSGTVVDALLTYHPAIATVGESNRPGIVHRLDKNTEGLMVIAKTNTAYTHLLTQFKEHRIIKKYQAMVYGNLEKENYQLDFPIGKHPQKGHLKWVCADGKPSETRFTVIKRFNTKTLIDITPITGRTHQIRVHLAYLGHPIMGDPEYGPKKNALGQQLIAYSLTFTHPRTQKRITVRRFGLS